MAYIPPYKRHLKDTESSSPTTSSFAHPLFQRNSNPRFNSERRKDKPNLQVRDFIYSKNSISRWCLVCSTDDDNQLPASVRLLPIDCDEYKSGEKPKILVCNFPQRRELNEIIRSSVKSSWEFIADKIQPDILASFQTVRNEMFIEESEEIKPSFVARFGKIFFHGSPSVSLDTIGKSSAAETALSQLKRTFYTNIPNSYMEAILDGVVPKIGVDFDEEKEYYHVKVFDKFQPDATTISCKCSVMEAGGELELHKIELRKVRHLVADISCLQKDLDLRLMLFSKRILTALTDDEMDGLRSLIKSAVIDPDVKGGLRWPLGKESSDRYCVIAVWHTKAKSFKSSSMKIKLRHADRFDFRTSTGQVAREVSLKMTEISRKLMDGMVERNPITDMLQNTLKLIWDNFLCCEFSFTRGPHLDIQCSTVAEEGARTSSFQEGEECTDMGAEATSPIAKEKGMELQSFIRTSTPPALRVESDLELSQKGPMGNREDDMQNRKGRVAGTLAGKVCATVGGLPKTQDDAGEEMEGTGESVGPNGVQNDIDKVDKKERIIHEVMEPGINLLLNEVSFSPDPTNTPLTNSLAIFSSTKAVTPKVAVNMPATDSESILPFLHRMCTGWAEHEELEDLVSAAREFIRLVGEGLLDDTKALDLKIKSSSATGVPQPSMESVDFKMAIAKFPWFFAAFPQSPRFPLASSSTYSANMVRGGRTMKSVVDFVHIHCSVYRLHELSVEEVLGLLDEVESLEIIGFNCSVCRPLFELALDILAAKEAECARRDSLERLRKEKEMVESRFEQTNSVYMAQERLEQEKRDVKEEEEKYVRKLEKQKGRKENVNEELKDLMKQLEVTKNKWRKVVMKERRDEERLKSVRSRRQEIESKPLVKDDEILKADDEYKFSIENFQRFQEEPSHYRSFLDNLSELGFPSP